MAKIAKNYLYEKELQYELIDFPNLFLPNCNYRNALYDHAQWIESWTIFCRLTIVIALTNVETSPLNRHEKANKSLKIVVKKCYNMKVILTGRLKN